VTGSPFLDFAERHDLDYAERVAPEASGRFPLPRGKTTDLVGGALADGREGLVARLRRSADDGGAPADLVLVVTRIPESVEFARFIACVATGFRGLIARAIGEGGLGWIREFTFESIEFNRRYRMAMLRTGKESRLRQLFSPTFLDWMADQAPEGLYFDLVSGVLTVTVDGGSVNDAADVERACELAGGIAERIRSEALEGTLGDSRTPPADGARAAAEAKLAAQIERAGFASPPSDVRSALDRLGPVIEGEKGLLRRVLGSRRSSEAMMVSLIAVLRAYADRAGLEPDHPDELHELLPFLDHFPLPVMRQHSLEGELPRSGRAGALVALLDLSAAERGVGLAYRPAVEIPTPAPEAGFVRVLPRGERGGTPPSLIGGFGVPLGEGAQRVTDSTRRERDRAAALAAALGGRFDVVAHGTSLADGGEAAQRWLASGAGDALVLESGKLTLAGPPLPVIEWSFETLDEFCASVAPVVAEVAPVPG
jgi:hypothetical protein